MPPSASCYTTDAESGNHPSRYHTPQQLDTLWDDVDALWDDVGAMRREFSVLVSDVGDTNDIVKDIQHHVGVQSQTAATQRIATEQLQSSVTQLSDELGSVRMEMTILKEKNKKMEAVLGLLLMQQQHNLQSSTCWSETIAAAAAESNVPPAPKALEMERSSLVLSDQSAPSAVEGGEGAQ